MDLLEIEAGLAGKTVTTHFPPCAFDVLPHPRMLEGLFSIEELTAIRLLDPNGDLLLEFLIKYCYCDSDTGEGLAGLWAFGARVRARVGPGWTGGTLLRSDVGALDGARKQAAMKR